MLQKLPLYYVARIYGLSFLLFMTITFLSDYEDPCIVEEDEVIGWELKLERASPDENSKVLDSSRNYAISIATLDPVSEDHPSGCKCMLAKCALMQALLKDDDEYLDGEEILDLT